MAELLDYNLDLYIDQFFYWKMNGQKDIYFIYLQASSLSQSAFICLTGSFMFFTITLICKTEKNGNWCTEPDKMLLVRIIENNKIDAFFKVMLG